MTDRVAGTVELEPLAECDVIIEEIGAKRELFGSLNGLCPERTIVASNTSSLTITEMAASSGRPDRFVGLHFFNPVPVMALVEVVRAGETSQRAGRAGFSDRAASRDCRCSTRVFGIS